MLLRLGGFFFIVSVIFWLWAIFDSISADGRRVRNLPKWAWVAIVLVFLEVGALAWALLGRPRGSGQPPAGAGSRRTGSSTPVGPDDDPDFLRGL
jgi:hypothetical protein